MPESNQQKNSTSWKWVALGTILLSLIPLGLYINKEVAHEINSNYNINSEPVLKNINLATIKSSWQHYFTLWEAKNDKNWQKLECPISKDTGMACLRRQGNLNQIQQINHPVLLLLEHDKVALVNKLSDNTINILDSQNEFIATDTSWLNAHWLGTYFIIWPMPAHLLVNPTSHDLQIWALEMANTLSLEKITSSALKQWIIEFQKQHGLLADGIIGKETQMSLSLLTYNGPTLDN